MSALQTTLRATASKSPLVILSGVLVEALGDTVKLVATDLELCIEVELAASVREPGSIVLPGRYLGEVVRKLHAGNVDVEVAGGTLVARLVSGRSVIELNGWNPSEFPGFPEGQPYKELVVEARPLQKALRRTLFAVSHDDMRAVLTGVFMNAKGDCIEMVATDGVRLAYNLLHVASGGGGDSWSAIVPGRVLLELLRLPGLDENIRVKFSENQVLFEASAFKIASRLIEGRYPAYERAIPSEFITRALLDTAEFRDACERAWLLVREESGAIRISLKPGEAAISSRSSSVGGANESVWTELEGEPLDVIFNARYLLDALDAIDEDRVSFWSVGPTGAARISPERDTSYFSIVLPLKPKESGAGR